MRRWRWRQALLPGVYLLVVGLPVLTVLVADPFSFPLPLRVEISLALGLVAVPVILIQFALVSRIRLTAGSLGTDALIRLHQYGGLLALALVVAHVVLLNLEWLPLSSWFPIDGLRSLQMGAISFWSLVLLAITTVFRQRLHVSYEAWRLLHMGLAAVASLAMFLHLALIQGYTGGLSTRVVIGVFLVAAAAVTLDYRIFRPLRLRRRPWQVVLNREEGASIRTIRVRPVKHEGMRFRAGQFAWLITGRSPLSVEQHPLSFSSSPDRPDRTLEFSIKALGDWSSTVVPALTPGTRVWVDGPFGNFTPDLGSLRPLVLIAGGIGIAPMRSILFALRDRREERHVHLIYAAHDESRVAFTSELEALRGSLHLSIVYVFESPADGWQGARGFVTAALLRRILKDEAARAQCYVCGPVPMMAAVTRAAVEAGVAPECIHTERFHVV